MTHFVKKLGYIALLLLLTLPAAAQLAEPPLRGPLIAMNTVTQEAVLFYDVATGRYRRVELDANRAHHIWDFSPDGCRMLVTLMEGTRPARLVTANLDGSDLREVVQFDELEPQRWGVWEPDWSPDGERIAFTMIRDLNSANGLQRNYHSAFVTLENPVPEFYSVTGREFSPQWSPDGAWLAYVSYDERAAGVDAFSTAVPTLEPPPGQTPTPATTLTEADIWIVSADAATKYPLTTFQTGNVTHPRWSPDGELISFVYSPSPNNDTMWMIANQQGAIPTQLSYAWGLVLDHTWLPDATAIISAMRDFQDVAENRLWTVPLLGNADENGTQFLAEQELTHADYPRFSPDGRWLAVRSAYELQLIDLTTTTRSALAAETLGNSPVVWSPAGFAGEATCAATD